MIVPSGPSHTTNAMAFLDFLEAAANDPRWSGDGMMPEIERNFDLGLDDKLIYRYLIIPIAKERVLEQAQDFAWIHTHGRPPWGPGRDGPFNLTKFNLLGLPDDGTVDNADFPSIWNAGLRENTSLNWAGETQDPLAVYIDSALGIGAPPETVIADMEQHREYLRAKQPPPYPFPIDEALAAQGEAGLAAGSAPTCHAPGGAYFGRTVPIEEIGTDRERFDTWTQANADTTNAKALELGVVRKAMVKDVGYANQPLDGIWLRAPYLHNGSVPSLTALLMPPGGAARRLTGAAATSTIRWRWASARRRPTTIARDLFLFDTTPARRRQRRARLRHRAAAGREGGAGRVPEDALGSREPCLAVWQGTWKLHLPDLQPAPRGDAAPDHDP